MRAACPALVGSSALPPRTSPGLAATNARLLTLVSVSAYSPRRWNSSGTEHLDRSRISLLLFTALAHQLPHCGKGFYGRPRVALVGVSPVNRVVKSTTAHPQSYIFSPGPVKQT